MDDPSKEFWRILWAHGKMHRVLPLISHESRTPRGRHRFDTTVENGKNFDENRNENDCREIRFDYYGSL